MTGVWLIKKNNVIIPYNKEIEYYEGIDVLNFIADAIPECKSGDTIEIICDTPE